jgi:MFS family permease
MEKKSKLQRMCSENMRYGVLFCVPVSHLRIVNLLFLVSGIVIDRCGRRWAICCSASLLVLGSVVSAVASSFPLLLCGRLMGGFAGALSVVSQCIYAAEVSESQSRGRGVLLYQLGVAVGLLLSSIACADDDTQWRAMIWLSAIPAAIQGLLAFSFLPYSPHFKLLQMSQGLHIRQSSACCALGNLAETVLLAFGLVFLQQFSGRPVVLYYAPRVFLLVGVCPDAAFTAAAIILNSIKVNIFFVFNIELENCCCPCCFPKH